MNNEYKNIKESILKQDKPFCLTDILNRLNKLGITNNGLIMDVLDDLYDQGLVEYIELNEVTGNTKYAFNIVGNEDYKKLSLKK